LDPKTSGIHPGLFDQNLLGIGFYTVWEAGLIFSGNVGTGIVLARNSVTGTWSPPAAVGLSGIGWGLMGGASRKTIVYLIYDYFTLQSMSGEHGAMLKTQAETSIGSFGRSSEISTVVNFDKEKGMGSNLALSFSSGIFAGISIEGAVCKSRNRVNQRFYGRPISTTDILFSDGQDITIPDGTLLPDVYVKLQFLCDGKAIYEPTPEEKDRIKSTRKLVDQEAEEALKEETIEYVSLPTTTTAGLAAHDSSSSEVLRVVDELSSDEYGGGNGSSSTLSHVSITCTTDDSFSKLPSTDDDQQKENDNHNSKSSRQEDSNDSDELIVYEVTLVKEPPAEKSTVPSKNQIDKMRAEAQAKAT
jgi:lipid-binding SYLF domain-containing protein